MEPVKRIWHYLLTEPFNCLFYYFFQPTNFIKKFETEGIPKRIILMLRLALPMFLVSYALAFIWYPSLNKWSILLGIVIGILVGIRWDIARGIALGIGLGIGLGIADVSNIGNLRFGLSLGLGMGLGIIGGAMGTTTRRILGAIMGTIKGATIAATDIIFQIVLVCSFIVALSSAGGYGLGYIIGGVVEGITEGILRSVAIGVVVGGVIGGVSGILAGISGGTPKSTSRNILEFIIKSIVRSIMLAVGFGFLSAVVAGIAGGIAGGIIWSILGGNAGIIALGVQWGIKGSRVLEPTLGIIIGAVLGLVVGIVVNIQSIPNFKKRIGKSVNNNVSGSLSKGFEEGIIWGIGWSILIGLIYTLATDLASSITVGLVAGIAFIIGYTVGYYRLPLYPISAFSMINVYLSSTRNPLQVFDYLHRSSLYWDERINISLLFLQEVLLIATAQNLEKAKQEIVFIRTERPQHIKATLEASSKIEAHDLEVAIQKVEVAIHSLEKRESLESIAQASQELAEILSQESVLIKPQWVTLFAFLNYASREAARYCSPLPLSWQARHNALSEMITNLKRVSLNEVSELHLKGVVNKWLQAAQRGIEELEKAPGDIDSLVNPYNPGPALKLRDSLFVGRRDLVKQLEEVLSKGNRRPTFMLNGERRMGKSSTLKQLPDLLGTRYLPTFYDLQIRGISSSTIAFLSTLVKEIYEVTTSRGMQVKKLEDERLQEASRKNDATVYYVFDEWLKSVERILDQQDRTLLLTFDEFEKLEEAGKARYLDLSLLLDWFRSIIQNRSRVALLFSGVHTLGEMGTETGINWAGYFVNVQTLKVSFLRPEEARQLITRPTEDFPSEQIFGEGVIDEIIRVTSCHPFLIQAVCSALIDNLNANKSGKAEIRDVTTAVNQVFENWWDTYFLDLWVRTDQNQQACLFAIRNIGDGNIQSIANQSGLDERTTRYTVQSLLKRDLVVLNDDTYRIAAPIFEEWVERNI